MLSQSTSYAVSPTQVDGPPKKKAKKAAAVSLGENDPADNEDPSPAGKPKKQTAKRSTAMTSKDTRPGAAPNLPPESTPKK